MGSRFILCLTLLTAVSTSAPQLEARPAPEARGSRQMSATPSALRPYTTTRSHQIGNIGFTVTNWGQFGSEMRGIREFCTRRPAPSFEFPRGSGLEYLWTGAMWIGAIKGRDTLVSVGMDGWVRNYELYPDPYPAGNFVERTNRPRLRAPINTRRCRDIYFSEEAVSEQDFIATYYDTVTNSQVVGWDDNDGRPHIPLGVQVTQASYAWSFDYAKDFVLVDFTLRNISGEMLNQLYMGLYMDHDVHHQSVSGYSGGALDDITGFTHTVPSPLGEGYIDTLNIAWIADNDGDPSAGRFRFASPTGVTGVRVVRAPTPDLKFSFNWWVSSVTPSRDWGPNKRNSNVVYLYGQLGTPEGDVAKYNILSNGEFDFDQIESALDHQVDGWLPPVNDPGLAADLANGFDTRYLLSFGPFDLRPDSTLDLTVAFIAGADLHTDPRNFEAFFDPSKPELYLERLDLTGLARTAQWAGWVYDTPGFDTDGDGNRGPFRIVGRDTVYYAGDGVPDFRGPPPPPTPALRFHTREGTIVMRWNGEASETMRDFFSNMIDFEGYRVYMGRTGQLADFALLTQRDHVNYLRYRYKSEAFRWIVTDAPFTEAELRAQYDDLVDSLYGYPAFSPDSFPVPDIHRALREVVLDDIDPSKLDTNYYYFRPYGSNEMADDVGLAFLADSLDRLITGTIRKRFPHATPADTVWEGDKGYPSRYEYEFCLDGLQLAEPVYLAVTAFDFGDPAAGLDPLETSPLANAQEVWPINSAAVVASERPKPGVYPNPYRLADDYNAAGWEDRGRQGIDPERARTITFTNIPETCTVSIWTLDGDLVKRIDHAEPPEYSQATVATWNLITRNTQAVKTGIYIYTIESRFGTDIGKLVIVK